MPSPASRCGSSTTTATRHRANDDETIGEVAVRGPNLFTGYLNRPDATEEAMRDGWFFTGDLATVAEDGYWRIVGRRSTDLIKTGGYKVGAGEIEVALLEHPACSRPRSPARRTPTSARRSSPGWCPTASARRRRT